MKKIAFFVLLQIVCIQPYSSSAQTISNKYYLELKGLTQFKPKHPKHKTHCTNEFYNDDGGLLSSKVIRVCN